MVTTSQAKGFSFEESVFGLLQAQIVSKGFGFLPECAAIFLRKKYLSKDRGSGIVFDVAIEVTLPGATEASFIWLWECKNYSRPISVDDVEEFNSKVLQVAGLNVKGGIACSGALQKSAFAYATSRKIAVIRILPENQVTWLLYNSLGGLPRDYATTDYLAAITQVDFRSRNRAEFSASHGYLFPVVSEMVRHVLLAEVPGLVDTSVGYRLRS